MKDLPVYGDGPCLADAVAAVLRLAVDLRVEVHVVQDDRVRTRQVQALQQTSAHVSMSSAPKGAAQETSHVGYLGPREAPSFARVDLGDSVQ